MGVLFGFGCNICYKTDDGSLKDISKENMMHLKDTLITFVGHADIIKYNEIYLCQLCCEELIRFDKFRNLCFSHLIQLPQKNFEDFNESDLDFNGQVINLQPQKNECQFVGDCSTGSDLNSVTKCDETRVAYTNEEDIKNVIIRRSEHTKLETFDVSNVNDTSQIQFMKEEIDLNDEIESSDTEIFTLTSFENKSGEEANLDVKEPVIDDSNNSMKQELHVKQENSHSEGVVVERIADEFGDGVHAAFEIANACTLVNEGNGENEDIRNQEGEIRMKLRSRRRNNNTTAPTINTHPSRAHARKSHNGSSTTALHSTASKRLRSGAQLDTCVAGNQSLRTRSSLVSHERIPSGRKRYKCTLCNKAFAQSNTLTIHKRTHSGNIPYRCAVCNKAFTKPSNLTRHKWLHSDDRPYNCTVCNKAFSDPSTLIKHKRIHSGDKPYKCTVYNKAFVQFGNLTTHKRLHCGDRPYNCTVCNKAFSDPSTLITHKRIHSGDKPYKCNVCNKAFTQSSNLTTHTRLHSGDRPYNCTVCNKAFSDPSTLIKHKRIHSGDKPYKCSVGNTALASSTTLTIHMRTHSCNRPYKCTVCNKVFAHSYNLTKHKRTHGGDRL